MGMVHTQVTAQGWLGSTPGGRRPQIRFSLRSQKPGGSGNHGPNQLLSGRSRPLLNGRVVGKGGGSALLAPRRLRSQTTSRQRAKSTAATERIGHGGATHRTANLCSKLNCASLPRPQGRAGARLFQQPDLEKHWVSMRNRALPSVMAFVAQATQPAGAL